MNVKGSPSRVTMHFQKERICVILFVLLSLTYNGDCKCIYKDMEKSALECTETFHNTQLTNLTMKTYTLDIHDAITLPPLTLQPEYFVAHSQPKSMIFYIRIHNTTLIKIAENAFGGLSDLQHLDITDNHLLKIMHPEAISNAPSLNILNLSGNTKLFKQIKGPILISEVLAELDLSRCEIEDLPYDAFDQLPKLTFLSLNHNKIKKLPDFVFGGLKNLIELDLSNNFLRNLPGYMLRNNTEINTLKLYGNPISNIPKDTFPDLLETELTLDLRETEMTNINIPPSDQIINLNLGGSSVSSLKYLSNFPKLKHLNLSYTKIAQVDKDSFENNSRLESIHLSGIPSLSLPSQFIGYFPSIYFMAISNCGLVHLMPDVFKKMTSIATLNLSRNALNDSESLGRALNPLANLNILDLSYNKLRVIGEEDLSANLNLNKLFLSGNQLLSPPSPSSIQSLTLLDLSYCTLTSIDLVDILQKNDLLQQLYLSNNNLSSITDKYILEISPTDIPASLIALELYENPWTCDPALLSLIERAKERGIQPSRYGSYGDQRNVKAHTWDSLAKEACSQSDYDVAITLMPLNLPPTIVGAKTEEFPVWIWYIFGIFLTFAIVCAIILDHFRRNNRHQSKGLLPPQKSMNISLVGSTGGMKVSGRSKDYQRLQEDRSPNSPTTPRIYRPPQNGSHFTFPVAQSAQGSESLEDFHGHENV
ncbi:leucine-rich repeat-containing protein 15-like isoform X2 [Ischnura elegans]|nr:leucine-rich repeat-containing protein 15-like isoform X2 [Ischnura elegans]